MPGSMAWESTSPIKARLRKKRNVPISPPASPSVAVLRTTSRVL